MKVTKKAQQNIALFSDCTCARRRDVHAQCDARVIGFEMSASDPRFTSDAFTKATKTETRTGAEVVPSGALAGVAAAHGRRGGGGPAPVARCHGQLRQRHLSLCARLRSERPVCQMSAPLHALRMCSAVDSKSRISLRCELHVIRMSDVRRSAVPTAVPFGVDSQRGGGSAQDSFFGQRFECAQASNSDEVFVLGMAPNALRGEEDAEHARCYLALCSAEPRARAHCAMESALEAARALRRHRGHARRAAHAEPHICVQHQLARAAHHGVESEKDETQGASTVRCSR